MSIASYIPKQAVERAETIAWTTGLGAVTREALAERNELSLAVAQDRLDEAVRLELMDKKSVLVDYSPLYTATNAGRRFARKHEAVGGYSYALGVNKCHVTIQGARHMIACASVAAALERRYPDHRVIGELEIYRYEREHGRVVSVDIQTHSGRRSHSPDIVIWPPAVSGEAEAPLPVAVEVELSSKKKEELKAICRGLARCRKIEATVYFVEGRKVEEKLLDVIEELKAEETIIVNPLSEIIQPMPGFPLIDE
jgi:hypothetical protein